MKQDKNTMESYQLEMSLVDSRDDKLALIKWKCLEQYTKHWFVYKHLRENWFVYNKIKFHQAV